MAQLVRAPPCHGGGQGFKSPLGRQHRIDAVCRGKASLRAGFSVTNLVVADVAQLAEQLICNQQVIGSSPIIGSIN